LMGFPIFPIFSRSRQKRNGKQKNMFTLLIPKCQKPWRLNNKSHPWCLAVEVVLQHAHGQTLWTTCRTAPVWLLKYVGNMDK
jgi:hypothetical protein